MSNQTSDKAQRGLGRRGFLALSGGALSYLGMAGKLRAAADKVDVAIIGAGLSGMYAGMLLKEMGVSVTVLEARDRSGGRCLTQDSWFQSPDLGASQIGSTYARIIDTCQRLDIKLAPGSHQNAPYTPVLGGRMIAAESWSESKFNLTEGAERQVLPHTLFGLYISQRTPFDDVNAWRSAAAAQYDISIADWLKGQGASPEAVRLMYESSGRTPLHQRSVLRMLQEATRAQVEMKQFDAARRKELDHYEIASIISSHIVGGTSRLTDAMAAQLGDSLRLASPVEAIDQSADQVTVKLADGKSVKARFVLSALPFSSLRKIAFDPPMAGAQAEAVSSMPYNNQSQIWIEIKAPYWEDDGLGASMWTDGPLQYVRQQIQPDGSRQLMSAIASSEKAARLDAMPAKQRGEFAIREIERMRPSTQGKLEVVGVHSWSEGASAGGCSFELPVGKAASWLNAMGKPHGRVHFSGEHLRQAEVGMEAAMETGERAVIKLAEALFA